MGNTPFVTRKCKTHDEMLSGRLRFEGWTNLAKHPLIRPMHAETELKLFVFVSALDIFATYVLLRDGNFVESNPVAQFFFSRWGIKGMIYFKLGMVTGICTIAHVVSLQRPEWARRLLQFASVVVTIVVVYSVLLLLKHGQMLHGPAGGGEMDLSRAGQTVLIGRAEC